ncbi:MAG: FHA domain-containing protein [Acidimicrobiia bacterium]|nr:FHA domain-containing protein [Acidimicrobiia bacterium]
MSEPLLTILKLCLLALLYLFFFRVLRAVWVEIRPPQGAEGFVGAPRTKRTRRARRTVRAAGRRNGRARLLVVEPPEQKGRSYEIGSELTVGRAAGCRVTVDDTYVSQLHARVYASDGGYMVEDLGSTNGTYLNRERVSGSLVMRPGDRLQVGNTVLELT